MSRGEELRAKFKAKGEAIRRELESPFGQFRFRLQSFVSEVCDASIEDGFARFMYERWDASETGSLDVWLIEEVKPLFKSAGSAPRWRLEPHWLYHGDQPMTFVTQYDHD
ncbi:hypothetical protein NDN16_20675 [Aureimonas altamirensis]|uniref:hypothetical protein n=1 Tax=Aureimonas altamirensis TaxID=370622 RepID=UPI0020369380|nr:hypothetical protein [Aureimonas altamirensis]MCM2506073.1 hypothetical protein [Aureimonas altamirensis]